MESCPNWESAPGASEPPDIESDADIKLVIWKRRISLEAEYKVHIER